MIIVYLLSAMFFLGMVAIGAWIPYTLWQEESPTVGIVAFSALFPLCVLFGLLPLELAAQGQSPTLATLSKNEWVCSSHYYRTSYVMINKVMTPTRSKVCTSYSRQ